MSYRRGDYKKSRKGAFGMRLPAARLPAARKPRPIHMIARDIRDNWPNVNYAAEPYLSAMSTMIDIHGMYFSDTNRDVVLRFLSNAATWRGEDAQRIKAELKALLK